MDRCPPSRASVASVLEGCRGPLYGLGWQLGRTQHDDFAATLGPARCATEARVRIEDRVLATSRGTAPLD